MSVENATQVLHAFCRSKSGVFHFQALVSAGPGQGRVRRLLLNMYQVELNQVIFKASFEASFAVLCTLYAATFISDDRGDDE